MPEAVMANEERADEGSEIDGILSDLDRVLADMGLTSPNPPMEPAPAPAIPPLNKGDAGSGRTASPQLSLPFQHVAPVRKDSSIPPETPRPTMKQPAPSQKQPRTDASPLPVITSSKQTEALPPTTKQTASVAMTPPAKDLKIELGPAMGIGKPPLPTARPAPGPTSKTSSTPPASSVKPPLEIKLDPSASAPKIEREKPSPQRPAVEQAPAAEKRPADAASKRSAVGQDVSTAPKPQQAAAAPAPAVVKPAFVMPPVSVTLPRVTLTGADIPSNISDDQIRTLAFLYIPSTKGKFQEFIQFIDSMATHLTKKPLYLRQSIAIEMPTVSDYQPIVDSIRASGAVGVVGVLPEGSARALEDAFAQASLFFRLIRPEDVGKRSAGLDLLVDITLVAAG